MDALFYCCLVAKSCLALFVTPWAVARQALLSTGLSGQKYWRGLPFPSPWDLHDAGVKTLSPALVGRFFSTEPPGKPLMATGGHVFLPPRVPSGLSTPLLAGPTTADECASFAY